MKTCKLYFLIFILVPFFWSCDGDPGPVGPAGPEGPEGIPGPLALEYETTFSLNPSNNWSTIYTFPPNDEIYATDMVLVYMLWDVVNKEDQWRLMPVNYFENGGMLEVNYVFTQTYVTLFADASFPLDNDVEPFEDIVARIVVIPAEMSSNQRVGNVDFTNYEEVRKTYHLPDRAWGGGKTFKEIVK